MTQEAITTLALVLMFSAAIRLLPLTKSPAGIEKLGMVPLAALTKDTGVVVIRLPLTQTLSSSSASA